MLELLLSLSHGAGADKEAPVGWLVRCLRRISTVVLASMLEGVRTSVMSANCFACLGLFLVVVPLSFQFHQSNAGT